jgi:hypothetical protein
MVSRIRQLILVWTKKKKTGRGKMLHAALLNDLSSTWQFLLQCHAADSMGLNRPPAFDFLFAMDFPCTVIFVDYTEDVEVGCFLLSALLCSQPAV